MLGTRTDAERLCTDRGFALWHATRKWLRSVDAALRPLGLTHTRYLVLDVTERLIDERGDAVAMWEIAERTGLAKSTTSAVVYKLELDGLLSRGPDGLDGRFLRIFVSGPGRETLTLARDAVDAVSARFFPVPTAG